MNIAVALGVAAATAVLTGALIVGDSVRSSLRKLTLDRLGRIDEVLIAERFFRADVAANLKTESGFKDHFQSVVPAIIFPQSTVEYQPNKGDPQQISRVLIVGADDAFWALGDVSPRQPGPKEIVLNAALAGDLGVTKEQVASDEGVQVTLRFPTLQQVPAENPLGKKDGLIRSLPRLKVIDIVPAESLGRFSLHPSQGLPRNAYVSLETLQSALRQEGNINAILAAGDNASQPPDEQASQSLGKALRPSFEDYGFRLTHAVREFEGETIFNYYSLSSERMILSPEIARAAQNAFPHAQPIFTYLANAIIKLPEGGAKPDPKDGIPYSTVSALEWSPTFHPKDARGAPLPRLADDEIVLNSWAATDLGARVDDIIRIAYFEAETSYGEAVEKTADFKLVAVTPITEPQLPYDDDLQSTFESRPAIVNDPDLTPFVPGVTDTDSIEEWDVEFPMTRPIRGQDDEYWKNHRTTPKAFISPEAGRRLWENRFGEVTSFRIPTDDKVSESDIKNKFTAQLRRDGVSTSLEFNPVKRQQLQASSGATPFDVLFLLLSMFIIAAALMLVSLLFRLGVDQRASELGLLLAVGVTRPKATRWFVMEGVLVAIGGGLLGVAVGVAYARLMILGLTTWWIGAVVTPFLEMHLGAAPMIAGFASGVIVSSLTIWWTIRGTRKVSERQLLAGDSSPPKITSHQKGGVIFWIVLMTLCVMAVGLGGYATQLGGEAQAGAFMGSGFLILAVLLAAAWRGFRGDAVPARSVTGLSWRSAGRNPLRSTLTIGLIAMASFLVVAVSSFRLDPTDEGTGGFELLGETSQPVIANLTTREGKQSMFGDEGAFLQDADILSLRYKPGDDASCNNLYRAAQPRALGVTPEMVKHFGKSGVTQFQFAASAAQTEPDENNPWNVLGVTKRTPGEAVPVVIDKNTAMYALQLYGGIGEEFTINYNDTTVTYRVAGLLSNSVLQGSLLIGEADFKAAFPNINGYGYFLINPAPGKTKETVAFLRDQLSDQGFSAKPAREVLTQLLAVQNTYISTFQSLGALGLLLGTFGVAAVQLRNVFERRKELALMQAVGYRRTRLAGMVLIEHATLLFLGLMVGVIAATISVAPHYLFGGAQAPVFTLAVMLTAIVVVGIVTGIAAMIATLRAPLISALRGE